MAKKDKAAKAKKKGRLKQIVQTLPDDQEERPADRADPARHRSVTAAVGFGIFYLLLPDGWLFGLLIARSLFGILAALIVFGRRAQKAAYAQIEGQPGAAAAALGMLRSAAGRPTRRSRSTSSRTSCTASSARPGIVLIGEGNPNRLSRCWPTSAASTSGSRRRPRSTRSWSATARARSRCRKLVRHVTKLGRNAKPAEMTDVLARLKALDANRSNIPIPKGPVPTSMKGSRQNMRGR